MFQSASGQTIKPLPLLCVDTVGLSLHLNGMVYSSTIQLQRRFAVQANAQPLPYRGTKQHILKITGSLLSVKN